MYLLKIIKNIHVFNVGHFGLKILPDTEKSWVNTDGVLQNHIKTSQFSHYNAFNQLLDQPHTLNSPLRVFIWNLAAILILPIFDIF